MVVLNNGQNVGHELSSVGLKIAPCASYDFINLSESLVVLWKWLRAII